MILTISVLKIEIIIAKVLKLVYGTLHDEFDS